MSIVIAAEAPDRPELAPLLAAAEAASAALYPPESNHMIGLDTLLAAHATFLVARHAGLPVGCAALVGTGAAVGELKRMFVMDQVRGGGIGRALLEAIERVAGARGISLIQLETGIHSHAALALYRRAGYVERGPFASYAPDPLSVFMEKPVQSQS